MLKQYIVISESRHNGLVAWLETLPKAKKLLKIENELFYIFKYNRTEKFFSIKIKYPLYEYYDALQINEYEEEYLGKNDDYIIITHDNECDKDCLVLTHKEY